MVKNPPVNAGDIRDWGSIPGSGRSLEEGMAVHSSILARRFPWTQEYGRLEFRGVGKSWTLLKQLSMNTHTHVCVCVCVCVYREREPKNMKKCS